MKHRDRRFCKSLTPRLVSVKHSGPRGECESSACRRGIHARQRAVDRVFARFKTVADRRSTSTTPISSAIVRDDCPERRWRSRLDAPPSRLRHARMRPRDGPPSREDGDIRVQGIGGTRAQSKRRTGDRHDRRRRASRLGVSGAPVTEGIDALGNVTVRSETFAARVTRRGEPIPTCIVASVKVGPAQP